jgi:hypothetical protein
MEQELYERLASSRKDSDVPGSPLERMWAEINSYVSQELGAGFAATTVSVGRGSVEILVGIAAVFDVIANWDDAVRNVGRLLSRLRALFSTRRIAPLVNSPGPPSLVEGTWEPDFDVGSVLLIDHVGTLEIPVLLVGYLILSNMALIGVLIWLLASHR